MASGRRWIAWEGVGWPREGVGWPQEGIGWPQEGVAWPLEGVGWPRKGVRCPWHCKGFPKTYHSYGSEIKITFLIHTPQ